MNLVVFVELANTMNDPSGLFINPKVKTNHMVWALYHTLSEKKD